MSYDIKNLFEQKITKEDMQAADDSRWAPAVVQVPSDDPTVRIPSQFAKAKWPADVENVLRPRYGRQHHEK